MDLGTTITGIVLLILCILPIVFFSRNRKKREKELFQTIADLAANDNTKISQFEHCGDLVIGMDEGGKSIYFAKRFDENQIAKVVNLKEVKNCKVVNVSRKVSNENGSHNVLEKLELKFEPVDKSKSEYVFEFYRVEDRIPLNGELQLIEKWAGIAKARLQ